MKVEIHEVDDDPVKERNVELVERKGLGHPDSICDGIAEAVSRELSKAYRDKFGKILHHNTDEVQLVAGKSNPGLGGGKIHRKIYILLTGRATKKFEGKTVPVDDIAIQAAREYIEESFKRLSSDEIHFESRIGETSTDLKSIFSGEAPLSNDTSFGVGHAPISPTEKAVKQVEDKLHTELSEVGEDVKVMGLRRDDKLQMTVAAATICSEISNLEKYREVKQKVEQLSQDIIRAETDLTPEIHVNTADHYEEDSIYLTVTGTSAEMGDDGSVGRGNRVSGLITPHRSMSMEAASGKNPVTHVGKIYNLLAHQIAGKIYEKTGEYAGVKLLSQIGKPIDQPQQVEVETRADRQKVDEIVEEKFQNIQEITEKCANGEVSTF
ncbi:MAG: methionine adenosyltransferase [Candidatus Nanohaloarchaea archaeon]